VFLVYTGTKIIRHTRRAKESRPEARSAPTVVLVSDEPTSAVSLTRINGKRAATPLLAALFVVEISDIVFASTVPILAVSNEAYRFASSFASGCGRCTSAHNAKDASTTLAARCILSLGLKMTPVARVEINTYLSLA